MWFGVVTLFPEMFASLEYGITGRALKDKLIELHCWNPRDFATNKHRQVDDRPYGGGPGMVMMASPLQAAISFAKNAAPKPPKVILLSPQGKCFNQHSAQAMLETENLILVAGRYEGVDERLIDAEIDEEWSVGDYVLSGGELPAMIMIDTITRLIPGALGHEESASSDTLSDGLLKYPQFTRPESFQDVKVPEVLLSGNHEHIERWRLKQSLGRTWHKRPDLLAKKQLNKVEKDLLEEFIEEYQNE